jgi:hypothetical protein
MPTFDLSYVVEQLVAKAEYAAWSRPRFDQAVQEYARFLVLCKLFPTRQLAPAPDADEIWHRHMLNSRRYMADCQAYFGYYLHHEPNSSADETEGDDETAVLYEQTFGQKLGQSDGSKCSRRPCTTCKPTKVTCHTDRQPEQVAASA